VRGRIGVGVRGCVVALLAVAIPAILLVARAMRGAVLRRDVVCVVVGGPRHVAVVVEVQVVRWRARHQQRDGDDEEHLFGSRRSSVI